MKNLYCTVWTLSSVQYTLKRPMTHSAHMFTVPLTMAHALMDPKQKRVSHYGGSSDYTENALKHCYVEPSSRTQSASTTFLATSTPTSRHQSRPKGHNSDGDLCKNFPEAEFSNKQHISRPNSLENSENASSSSSPLNLKGSFDRIHGRSESLSSEDMVQSRDMTNLCRDGLFSPNSSAVAASNTKHRSGLFSTDGPQKNVYAQPLRHRSASPGSEMVTLEEFLEESSRLSPLNDMSSRDDLLSDYFRKANEPPSMGNQLSQAKRKEAIKMPTSYVTPTVKMLVTNEEGRPPKPGHYVKPSPRPAESELLASATGSHKLTHASQNQPGKGIRQTAQPLQLNASSRQSTSLNRTFSLASADLLKATGPETYRRYESLPKSVTADARIGKEVNSQTLPLPSPAGSQVPLRERPQSAKLGGSLQGVDARCRQLDVRRLSLAPPKDERLLPFPGSPAASDDDLNCQPLEPAKAGLEQHRLSPHAAPKIRPKSAARSGEVATVTPVRVVSSCAEGNVPPALSPSDSSVTKCQSQSPENKTLSGSTEEASRAAVSKNPSASPDPHSDQQTVWYEYGCV